MGPVTSIHELQIATFPLQPAAYLQHVSGIYGEDKIMQSFQDNNHRPRRMIWEYLFAGRVEGLLIAQSQS